MAVAAPAGVVLGVALALAAVWLGVAGANPVVGGAAFALCLSVPAAGLVYVAVVDRSTLRGAVERPEESVESKWYGRAAAGALTDVVLLAGVGAMLVSFLDTALDDALLLGVVVAVAMLSFAVRYALARRAG